MAWADGSIGQFKSTDDEKKSGRKRWLTKEADCYLISIVVPVGHDDDSLPCPLRFQVVRVGSKQTMGLHSSRVFQQSRKASAMV